MGRTLLWIVVAVIVVAVLLILLAVLPVRGPEAPASPVIEVSTPLPTPLPTPTPSPTPEVLTSEKTELLDLETEEGTFEAAPELDVDAGLQNLETELQGV